MHFRGALLAALFLSAPLATAEGVDVQAGGLTLGYGTGIAGVQWDDEGGVGTRYWYNGTSGGSLELLATVCVSNDAHTVYHCERYPIAP